jgi:hypothetical protein
LNVPSLQTPSLRTIEKELISQQNTSTSLFPKLWRSAPRAYRSLPNVHLCYSRWVWQAQNLDYLSWRKKKKGKVKEKRKDRKKERKGKKKKNKQKKKERNRNRNGEREKISIWDLSSLYFDWYRVDRIVHERIV